MGFTPTKCDPDLWIKLNHDKNKYEYIATYVDDLIIVAEDPKKYLDIMKQQYPIWRIEMTPENYPGNNIKIRENNTIKINSLK